MNTLKEIRQVTEQAKDALAQKENIKVIATTLSTHMMSVAKKGTNILVLYRYIFPYAPNFAQYSNEDGTLFTLDHNKEQETLLAALSLIAEGEPVAMECKSTFIKITW